MEGARTRLGRRPALVAAAAVFLLALIPRLIMARQSLFGDELFTYDIVTRPSIADSIHAINSFESTPPGFHALAWISAQIADARWAIRVPSVLAGAGTAAAIVELGRRTFGFKAGIAAGIAVALDPFLVFYGSEARAYGTATFLDVLAVLFLVMYADGRERKWLIAFTAAGAAAVLMHYTAALPLAGAGLYALYKLRDPKLIASGAVMCAGVGAWLIVAGGGPAPRVLSAFYPTTFKNVLESLAKIMAGLPFSNLSDVPGTPVGVLLLLAAVVGVGTLIVRRADIPASAGPVLAAAISPPLFLLVAALLGNDLFVPRSLTGMAPFAWLVIVAGLTQLPKAVFAATAVLLVIALVLANQPDERRPDYKAVARFLEGNVKPGDAIVEREIFPLGPLALTLEVELDKPLHITELTDTAAAKAAATGTAPRLFVVTPGRTLPGTGTIETGGRKPIESRTYPGLTPLTVTVYGPAP